VNKKRAYTLKIDVIAPEPNPSILGSLDVPRWTLASVALAARVERSDVRERDAGVDVAVLREVDLAPAGDRVVGALGGGEHAGVFLEGDVDVHGDR
jgi:hypothetical protein